MTRPSIQALEAKFDSSPEALLGYLTEVFHIPVLRLSDMQDCTAAFDAVPYTDATRRNCAAMRDPAGALLLVLTDPYDGDCQDWIEENVRTPFSYRLAHSGELAVYLSKQEEGLRAMDAVVSESLGTNADAHVHDVSIEAITDSDSPVVKLVTSTLYDAMKSGASDIHLETGTDGLAIKYRIDGVLSAVRRIEGPQLADQVISRVKVISELDIAERRVPQDGRFRVRSKGRNIDLRVSIMPSVFGEDAVLRILDKQSLSEAGSESLGLERLGFEPATIAALRRLATEPHGMLLVTGPTGSGKTTTLYALISEANSGMEKMITIEDPVEYQLPGVLQIPVNENKGLTFARGLRSILRHDPDRIMVGEIRDPETAEIAVQSALTGHLVFTTVHANNVFDVIGRFMHMGVDTFNLASALNGVMAQRLVRVLCKPCQGKGCASCRGTGFKGRKAIAELMVLNDELREMIASRAPTRRVKEAARAAGTGSLREAAIGLVGRGETTLEEINRVTFVAH